MKIVPTDSTINVMACIIFGAKLSYPFDLVSTFGRYVPKNKLKDYEEDPEEFFNDISVPLKLTNRFVLWQPNNVEWGHFYLSVKTVKLEEQCLESVLISPPPQDRIDAFEKWLEDDGIDASYGQYLVLLYDTMKYM